MGLCLNMMKLADTEYILVMFDIWSYGFFGHMIFYLFGRLVINSVIQFSIYLVLCIRSNEPACKDT